MSACQASTLIEHIDAGSSIAYWLLCGRPAIAQHRYACVHEHVIEKFTCGEHAPEPGIVGCLLCFEAGHECPMSAELIEALI